MSRLYLPTTLPGLATAMASGELALPPVIGYAVTPELREWYVEGDAEELEYAAMSHAAQAALVLLAADEAAPARRVVVAVDVPDEQTSPAPEIDRAAVRISSPVPMQAVVAVHVDDAAAIPDIAVAASRVHDAIAGDEDAEFAVESALDHELGWYAAQEIEDLLRG